MQAFATPHWSYVEDYPQTANRAWMPVQPGFDPYLEAAYTDKYVRGQAIDAEAVRRHGPAAAARREDGAFFARQLLRAREVDPEIIFLSGWNDWQCCLQLEPAVEYGCTYLDLTARLLGREAETAGYRRDEK